MVDRTDRKKRGHRTATERQIDKETERSSRDGRPEREADITDRATGKQNSSRRADKQERRHSSRVAGRENSRRVAGAGRRRRRPTAVCSERDQNV